MGILNHKYRDEKYARRLLIAGLFKFMIVCDPSEYVGAHAICLAWKDMNDQQMIEKSNDKIEPDYLDDDPSSDIDLTEATQTIAKVSKGGAFSRWSFDPNSAWGSIETMTIGKTHLTLSLSISLTFYLFSWKVTRRKFKKN